MKQRYAICSTEYLSTLTEYGKVAFLFETRLKIRSACLGTSDYKPREDGKYYLFPKKFLFFLVIFQKAFCTLVSPLRKKGIKPFLEVFLRRHV